MGNRFRPVQGEFRGDFSRDTFDPSKHFRRVLVQQGRVQLDADWNEQVSILLHYVQTLAKDLIGPHWGSDEGFRIAALKDEGHGNRIGDFQIQGGNYYVDGILCQLSSSTTYLTQPHYHPFHNPEREKSTGITTHLVYLDVWERCITYLQDDSIREAALGGPDTAARSKVVWQVKTTAHVHHSREFTWQLSDDCPTWRQWVDRHWDDFTAHWQPEDRGWLKARVRPSHPSTDPCTISPDARYRGAENQLYRVEIHTGGTIGSASPTFKWSRENGAVLFPILSGGGTNSLKLENLGRDDRFSLKEHDWVEVVDDESELRDPHAVPGNLLQVDTINRNQMQITLTGTPNPKIGADQSKHPLLRRWDQKADDQSGSSLQLDNGAVSIKEGHWLDLEDGIQIQFERREPNNHYRSGDYWLIPARVDSGDVEWPVECHQGKPVRHNDGGPIPMAQPPHGIEHHYAPLAVITVAHNGDLTVDPRNDDCRRTFKPNS